MIYKHARPVVFQVGRCGIYYMIGDCVLKMDSDGQQHKGQFFKGFILSKDLSSVKP